MPEATLRFVLAIVLLASSASALEIEGGTHQDRRFRGTFVTVQTGILELVSSPGNATRQGLPLEVIEWIQPVELTRQASLLIQLEPLLVLYSKWSQATRQAAVAAVEGMAESSDWTALHYWSQKLLESGARGSSRTRLVMLHGWSLLQLGSVSQAREALAGLIPAQDPLEAEPLYCRLMACLADAEGDLAAARRWASIPLLRIPAAMGRERPRLEKLLHELNQRK